MVVAIILNLVTTLLVMAPSLVLNFGTLPITVLPHAAVGTLALILGLLFSFKFLKALRSSQSLACGASGMMKLAIILWIVPIFFGTYLYLTIYIL